MKPLRRGILAKYRRARALLFGDSGHPYNPKRARSLFLSLLKKGDRSAALGRYGLYLLAKEEGNPDQIQELRKIALLSLADSKDSGEPEIEFAYASLLASSGGSKEEAAHYFSLASEKGHALAMANLAICYESGEGTVQNGASAFSFASQSSQRKCGFADYQLYRYYKAGLGTVADEAKAIESLKRSVKRGYRKAMLVLSDLYRKGQLEEKGSERRWVKLLKRAATLGYAPALVRLGYCYASGLFGLHFGYTYVEMFEKAKSSPEAKYALGLCFLEGVGLVKNEKGALALFEESAALGYRPAEFMVAKCHAEGIGTQKSETETLRHLNRYFVDTQERCLILGKFYAHGDLVEQNLERALECFREGVRLGSEMCRQELLRLEGSGRPESASVTLENAKDAEPEALLPLLITLKNYTFKEAVTALGRAPMVLFEDIPTLEAERLSALIASLGATATVHQRE